MNKQLAQISDSWMLKTAPTFNELSDFVLQTHQSSQATAMKAVNQMATLRNWLIGCYIVEYEQKGRDRAKYGERLLKCLEERVSIKGLNETLFRVARRFYAMYPQVCEIFDRQNVLISSDKFSTSQIHATPSHELMTPITDIISKLSFSHIREIMTQEEPLARFFYETECIKGTWSVKELRRQIATNLYYRSGVSKDPKMLLASIQPEKDTTALAIRQPFAFEFLGLNAKDVVSECDLEEALITHLQDFLLELGKGFCFECRQKRIIIDDKYYFVDLVFYNRILHCNVIVELKNDEFKHEYLGQLNAYVSYFKENEIHNGDNPPVGILLCTSKGEKMVEYAIAGMDNNLFVSTYMLQLPDKATLEKFLHEEINNQNL